MSGHFLPTQNGYAPPVTNGLPVVRPKKKLKAFHWDKVDKASSTHWAAHTPTAEEREEKYVELSKRGILDEVEKLFMAKEARKLGGSSGKKDDKKQIISNDLWKAFRKSLFLLSLSFFASFSFLLGIMFMQLTNARYRNCFGQILSTFY